MPKHPSDRPLDGLRVALRDRRRRLGRLCFGRMTPLAYRQMWLRHFPSWPFRPALAPPWPEWTRETPEAMKTVPGIWRDEEAANRAFAERPVYEFFKVHPEGIPLNPRFGWGWALPSVPARLRTKLRAQAVSAEHRQPPEPPPDHDPQALMDEIREEARRLGISQVGAAPYDPRYAFAGGSGHPIGARGYPLSTGSVVVCLLEQDWALTQTIPSARAERAVMRTYEQLVERAAKLAEFLQGKGIRAQVDGPGGPLVSIHYAVEAGLGQLGLNGQLLTPWAGSRARITLITTNARLAHSGPVDFGIHAVCDACQVCIRRCPPGAIPNKRLDHRGITKVAIKPERCLPTVAQAHACAICMKVCPVQRYGLAAVLDHHGETGEILGKGTDELEGFDWIDGRRYGPGQKPRITREFMSPLGINFDMSRLDPLAGSPSSTEEDLSLV